MNNRLLKLQIDSEKAAKRVRDAQRRKEFLESIST